MPMFNCERYVHGAINSILAQTFTNFELLVMDDGSTDRSSAVARSYKDPRLRVISDTHCGLVATLNRGIDGARGEYIARMDADDLSQPKRLERQVSYMEAHPELIMVGTDAHIIDLDGKLTGQYLQMPRRGQRIRVALCGANTFIHGSVLMRRRAVLNVGGYRSEFITAEDYDLWLRLGEIGTVANLTAPLYKLRVHHNSKTAVEGKSLGGRYAARARTCALQRQLYGHDCLGYIQPELWMPEVDTSKKPNSTAGTITLIDWAQSFLSLGELPLSYKLATQTHRHSLRQAHVFTVLFRCYASKASILGMLTLMCRGWLFFMHRDR